jgi:hypothetical protein
MGVLRKTTTVVRPKMTIFNSRTPSDVTRISVGTVRNAKNVACKITEIAETDKVLGQGLKLR